MSTTSISSSRPLWLLLLASLFLLTTPLSAQKDKDRDELEPDPYTEEDREAMDKAGYLRFGQMPWGDNHGTKDIDEAFAGEQMRWVETEHFRIGCSLPEYTIDRTNKVEKKKLEEELKRLREILPNVPKKAKKIDPWLRLHLWAMRAEDLYDEMEGMLGVNDESFPRGPGTVVNGEYMGEGPYLGMTDKYLILLTEKKSAIGRYRSSFMKASGSEPIRHMFTSPGNLMFAVAQENSGMNTDTNMHCLFMYSMTMNLLDGYKYYSHTLPAWIYTGLAHWNARRIDPKRNYFTDDRVFGADDKNIWMWNVKTRKRVGYDHFPAMSTILTWATPEELKYSEHMMAWSRVDYLKQNHPEGFAVYFDMMKGKLVKAGAPTQEDIQARQLEALSTAFKLDPASFDAKWKEWVMDTYPKK
jgi:hypothetical protein